ncbi:chromosome partitioning protein [Thiohalomonas denitrificans]|uniref:Chromosome partitioning protein n=2 Tax=Thiohalomonas denitrificans TaxID=415747 RepID=A0A1G5PVG3_9GAMM|nr:chromosome partitioning protein [Thiohalomonas denitrificans]
MEMKFNSSEQHSRGSGSSVASGPVMAERQPVRRILVLNGKGGCGKTTITTNLASYYASRSMGAAIFDHDPQGSSTQWLSLREGAGRYPIHGIAAHRKPGAQMTRTWQLRLPPGVQRVILDAPAGVSGHQLAELVAGVDDILIPVLPSPIDIHATSRFIQDLLLVAKARARHVRMGVIANRVRETSKMYRSLRRFLDTLDIAFIARLRDSNNYIRAAAEGLGIHEMNENRYRRDQVQWEKIIRWLESAEGQTAEARRSLSPAQLREGRGS